MSRFLVTGGAGFIGSNYVRFLLQKYPESTVTNLDKLTYAGNLENLQDIENDSRYRFVKGDICEENLVNELVAEADIIVNFAAESHVDRSIGAPDDFIKTDIFGAFALLEAARKSHIDRFIQISTDEVYGSIDQGSFTEEHPLMPSSPYSASKTGADRIAFSYFVTYGVPVQITRCSNNFGPFHYPEKLIPLFVTNAIENKSLPIYGDGQNIRDWIYVEDHCEGIDFVLQNGDLGEVYNIGGGNEKTNLEITEYILRKLGKPDSLKEFVKDRPGHDQRYSLDCSKLQKLGWTPKYSFEQAMDKTIQWYVDHPDWWGKIKSGEYLDYYKNQYSNASLL